MTDFEAWTEADLDRLRTLFAQQPHLSLTEIGQLLGKSKNSIVGKCNRLGLRRIEDTAFMAEKKRKFLQAARLKAFKAAVAKLKHKGRRLALKEAKLKRMAERKAMLHWHRIRVREAPLGNITDLFGLHRNGCRWPISIRERVHWFCNMPRAQTSPYCAEHAAMGWVVGKRR